jgi:hypothetical protein
MSCVSGVTFNDSTFSWKRPSDSGGAFENVGLACGACGRAGHSNPPRPPLANETMHKQLRETRKYSSLRCSK